MHDYLFDTRKFVRKLQEAGFFERPLRMYNLYIMQTHGALARTQIYLTQAQQAGLTAAARRAAVSKSELIRLAIDHFLDQQTNARVTDRSQRFKCLAGLWEDRAEMADPVAYVQALRQPRF